MIRDQYITVSEMQEIIKMCEALNEVFGSNQVFRDVYIPVFEDTDGAGAVFPVHDTNGDILGYVGHADAGFALYLDDGADE